MKYSRRMVVRSILGVLVVALVGTGCSEERKREAVRLAAELEAKERGETLPPEPVAIDSVTANQGDSGIASMPADSSVAVGMIQPQPESLKVVQDSPKGDTSMLPVKEALQESDRGMPAIITDGWTVQVESSPSQSYIEQQVPVFKDRGYDAYLGSVTKEGKTFYRLRVGRYTDRAEAVRVSAEINSLYGLQSWVDKGSW